MLSIIIIIHLLRISWVHLEECQEKCQEIQDQGRIRHRVTGGGIVGMRDKAKLLGEYNSARQQLRKFSEGPAQQSCGG